MLKVKYLPLSSEKKLMKKLICLFLTYSFIAKAHDKSVQVQIFDPGIDSSSLEEKYQVHKKKSSYSSLPNKEARDQVLSSFPVTSKWDELKKDIFIMDIKSKTLEELVVKYSEFTKNDFLQLKGEK